MRTAIFRALFCLFWFSTASALAQEAPAPSDAPATAPPAVLPDVVRLTNGGFFRCTVQEYMPGEYVVLTTGTGESKRIEAKDIAYVGSASQDPGSASAPAPATAMPTPAPAAPIANSNSGVVNPLITVRGEKTRIHFVHEMIPNQPGQPKTLTLYLRTGTSTAVASNGVAAVAEGFTTVCTAPCEADLPAGLHTMALGADSDLAVKASDPVKLTPGELTLAGSYRSRAPLRAVGWILGIGGAIAGTVLVVTALGQDAPGPMLLGGSVIGLGGLIGGLVMATRKDIVEIKPR